MCFILYSATRKDLASVVLTCYLKSSDSERPGLGCPENAKSLKSQAPQGFSGCLDIDNDEMNKKKILSASPRVK